MQQLHYFDPEERRREKDRARAEDDRALRNGEVSREELRMRNSFLAPLEIISSSIERPGFPA